MWKDVFRLLKKFICIVLPLCIVLQLYCALFPMNYMDIEYSMYRQQKDYVTENTDANRVLILGDSRTKAGFIPEALGSDVYNLALGGTTAVEGYYTLKHYLEHHPAPATVVIAYAPMHYMDVDALWTRNIYFHVMERADAQELFTLAEQEKNAGNERDTEHILIEDYEREYLMYQFYMPNKYATALRKAFFVGRRSSNREKYEDMISQRGHSYFGMAAGSGDVNGEAKVDDFQASAIISAYMQKIFDLCREQNIQVVVEQLPMNETSYYILTDSFKTHYREYMLQLATANPTVAVYGDFYCYSNDYFGDADHLNETGAAIYNQFMHERYPQLFTGN